MATEKNNRTGFPSLYRATYENGWNLKNTGFDYSTNLLNNTMSIHTLKSFWKIIFLLLWSFGLIE